MTNEPRMQLSVRESQKDMEFLFDFQTDILARKYFLNGKIDRIEHMLTSGDGIYGMLKLYYDFVNMNDAENLKIPYSKEEFSVKKEQINDEVFGKLNLFTIYFPKDLNPGAGQKVKVLYNDEKVRFYVLEDACYADGSHYIHEVTKEGFINYGRYENDDEIENKALLDFWDADVLGKADFDVWEFNRENRVFAPRKNLLKYKQSVGLFYGNNELVKTNRGIQIGDDIDKVFEKYGKSKIYHFNKEEDIFYIEGNEKRERQFKGNERFCDYIMDANYRDGLLRFYFSEDDKVESIGYIVRKFG